MWVKSDGLAVGRSLPVYPYQQTFSDADGMSQRCHEETHAPQQIGTLVDWAKWSGRLLLARSRQYKLELSEMSGLCLDINAAAVLFFYDDVVAHRQAKPGTFA
jgi:hypothetical protein